jgi:hypothetical protein
MTEQDYIDQGLCPELVIRHTEDGPTDGRCMRPIVPGEIPACEGHAAQIREWQEERDRLWWGD